MMSNSKSILKRWEEYMKFRNLIIKCCLIGATILTIILLLYISITQRSKIKKQEKSLLTIEMAFDSIDYESIETKYDFMDKRKAVYIEALCKSENVNSDLVFGHLMKENPTFDEFAINRDNVNGSVDLGLFQLNDYYLWTDFVPRYWIEGVDFDPFNWKHNAYIAVHHIAWLQKNLKVEDDVIMAYNCGLNAVINDRIPTSTKEVYLVEVRNNMNLLKKL